MSTSEYCWLYSGYIVFNFYFRLLYIVFYDHLYILQCNTGVDMFYILWVITPLWIRWTEINWNWNWWLEVHETESDHIQLQAFLLALFKLWFWILIFNHINHNAWTSHQYSFSHLHSLHPPFFADSVLITLLQFQARKSSVAHK